MWLIRFRFNGNGFNPSYRVQLETAHKTELFVESLWKSVKVITDQITGPLCSPTSTSKAVTSVKRRCDHDDWLQLILSAEERHKKINENNELSKI